MKLVSARVHGYLDYGLVLVFALAPTMLGLAGTAANVCYVLAMAHLSLTLMTAHGLGVTRAIPFAVHGAVEAAVAAALLLGPWIVGRWIGIEGAARSFFLAIGALLGIVWLVTDYSDAAVALERESLPRNSVI